VGALIKLSRDAHAAHLNSSVVARVVDVDGVDARGDERDGDEAADIARGAEFRWRAAMCGMEFAARLVGWFK